MSTCITQRIESWKIGKLYAITLFIFWRYHFSHRLASIIQILVSYLEKKKYERLNFSTIAKLQFYPCYQVSDNFISQSYAFREIPQWWHANLMHGKRNGRETPSLSVLFVIAAKSERKYLDRTKAFGASAKQRIHTST